MRENHKFLYTRKLITKCKSDLAIKALLYASVLVNCFLLIKVAFKKKNLKIMARLMVTNELTEFCIKQKKTLLYSYNLFKCLNAISPL